MELPLISHPRETDKNRQHPADQTTEEGHLLLTAHSTSVPERATTLFAGPTERELWLWVAATLHDFGKATPQFQEHVRPDEEYEGPDAEKRTTHGLEHSQRGSSSIGPVPPTAIVLLQRSRLHDITKRCLTPQSIQQTH